MAIRGHSIVVKSDVVISIPSYPSKASSDILRDSVSCGERVGMALAVEDIVKNSAVQMFINDKINFVFINLYYIIKMSRIFILFRK